MVKSVSEISTEAIVDLRATPKQITRVLHVDDDLSFLKVARSCLEMQGSIEVDSVSSVEEALRRLGEEEYDAVISDYLMPGKDGLEFLKELRQNSNAIPFILFTGKGREEIAIEALNLGAYQYLNKTGNPEAVYFELAHAIRKAVERKHAEEALRESEEKFRTISQRSFDVILTLNPEGEITYVSQEAVTVGGYEPQELVGKPFSRFLHEPESSDAAALLQRILAGEDAKGWELTFLKKNGTAATLEVNAFPLVKDGKIVEIRATARDITERKKCEAELRWLASFPERNPNPVLEIDLTGKITYLNPPARKILSQLRDSKLFNGLEEDFNAIISEFNIHQSDNFLRENVKIVNRYYQQAIHYVPEKAVLRLYMLDITERERAIEQMGKTSDELSRTFDAIADLVFIIDSDYRLVTVCKKICDLLKKKPEELVGKHCYEVMHGTDKPWPNCPHRKTLETRKSASAEINDPKIGMPLLVTISPIYDEKGDFTRCIHVAKDITERKQVEEELLKQKVKAEEYLNIVGNIVVALDRSGKITLLNRKGYKILGYGEGELVGKDWFETCLPEENKEEVKKAFEACVQGKLELAEQYENLILTKNGERRAVSWYNTVLKDDNGKMIGTLSSGEDITERRRTEEAFQKSAERERSLLEFQNRIIDTAVVWINILDRDGNVTLWNRAAELISGYSREEVIGHGKIWDWLYPDSSYCTEIFAQAKRTIDHQESAMHNFETVIKCKNGALKTIAWYANSITDQKMKPIGGITIGLDVSQLRKAEEELRKAMVRLQAMNEKLRVVGGLTRHDVRNKLTAVIGNTYLAKKKLPENSEVLDYLKQIEACVGQTVRILDFSRAYEMLGVEELAYIDLEKAVDEAISLFSGLKDVKITNDCHGLTVLADSLLVTLFYNLIDNSLKYGEKLTRIRVYCEEKGTDCLNVIYEDDGVGIPQAMKLKLFAEGYTTGKGSGCGLSLIKKMIGVYGWTIEEIGKPGEGARFVVTVPKNKLERKRELSDSRTVKPRA